MQVSELCLRLYLDEYDDTPWDALKYLISEINYGGRVTDDWDRRLMNVYMASFFNEEALNTPLYRLSSLPSYVVPEDGPLVTPRGGGLNAIGESAAPEVAPPDPAIAAREACAVAVADARTGAFRNTLKALSARLIERLRVGGCVESQPIQDTFNLSVPERIFGGSLSSRRELGERIRTVQESWETSSI